MRVALGGRCQHRYYCHFIIMFGECCHCPGNTPAEKQNQITYDPVRDPNAIPSDAISGRVVSATQQQARSEPPPKAPPPAKQAEEPPLSQRSQSSLTPEEKAAEKARLQDLVKTFAKNAVQGVACQLLEEQTGRMVAAKYNIDKQLKKMTVKSTEEGVSLQHVVPLACIQEIYRIEDGEGSFPKTAQNVNPPDLDRILMCLYTPDERTQQSQRLCFFEASPMDKERFLTCMKILRLYSQTSTPKSA